MCQAIQIVKNKGKITADVGSTCLLIFMQRKLRKTIVSRYLIELEAKKAYIFLQAFETF
jgi:hypothetical protein